MDDDIMTSQQAADKLGVKVQTIYIWIKAGILPASKIGKLFFIREADIQRLLNPQPIQTKPEKDPIAEYRKVAAALKSANVTISAAQTLEVTRQLMDDEDTNAKTSPTITGDK